jgi:hypothetical protein
LLPLLFLVLNPLLSSGQSSEAISREVSLFNFGGPSADVEAISREVSVFNFGQPSANVEAICREVSVFNFGEASSGVEAISREVSVFNFGEPSAKVEAISREVSIFNYGVPPVVLSIGSTNILKDEINRVPFTFQTVLDLTNLSLTLQSDDSHLQILGVTPVSPEIISTVLGTVSSNSHPIAFTLNPGAIPTTNHVLAWLNFQGITNLDSAVVPLTITNLTAARSSGQVVPTTALNGQVILIVNQPILFPTSKPQFGITMYGIPGATYAVEATTNLAPADWHELARLLETGPFLVIPALTNNASQQFYRTTQVGP